MERLTTIRNSELLRSLIYKGVGEKKVTLTDAVSDRIEQEISVIETKGFTDHFILYSRIIEVCDELRLIRSCGRGKSLNSMVNYCLDITKVNPVEENLLFENFVSSEQKNLPDIDIDVPTGFRRSVIERFKQKYSQYNIYPIATSIKEDTGRVAIHPCGVIITLENLSGSTFSCEGQELYYTPEIKSDPIYNNSKIDILELNYLRQLQLILNEIGEEYHPYKLPLNDQEVFDFFASGDLKNIFMFDAAGFDQLFAHAKPSSTSDLSKINLAIHPNSSTLHSLSYSILGYWGCYYKTHFRKEFEKVFSAELSED